MTARPKSAQHTRRIFRGNGLNVAESLLLGCQPVIVEGPSDQFYLTAIKTLLLSGGKITPKRELVFPPSGGTKDRSHRGEYPHWQG